MARLKIAPSDRSRQREAVRGFEIDDFAGGHHVPGVLDGKRLRQNILVLVRRGTANPVLTGSSPDTRKKISSSSQNPGAG